MALSNHYINHNGCVQSLHKPQWLRPITTLTTIAASNHFINHNCCVQSLHKPQWLRQLSTALIDVSLSLCSGNHELWIRDKAEDPATSIIKFHQIIAACKDIGVHTDPKKISLDDTSKEYAWIVPLFAWYATPEDSTDSLYVTSLTEDVKLTTSLWMDNRMCIWPDYPNIPPSKYFTDLNKDRVKVYDAPVISFSHFLPRQDLIRADETDDERMTAERRRMGLSELDTPRRQGAMAGFNFTRYAGCSTLERQLRQIGSRVHVFGHQHRNRDRTVDGVRYVSHCLGYKRERQQGLICGIGEWMGPKQVWPL